MNYDLVTMHGQCKQRHEIKFTWGLCYFGFHKSWDVYQKKDKELYFWNAKEMLLKKKDKELDYQKLVYCEYLQL